MTYDQYIPTHILFGAGQLNNLHTQLMPGRRALIVISNRKSTTCRCLTKDIVRIFAESYK